MNGKSVFLELKADQHPKTFEHIVAFALSNYLSAFICTNENESK